MKTSTLKTALLYFGYSFILLFSGTTVFAQTPVCWGPSIVNTSTAPVIDGTVDAAWAAAPVNSITKIVNGVAVADYAAQWRAMYDNTNLYILVEVKDAVLKTIGFGPNPWDDDDIEIYIDGNNSKTSYTSTTSTIHQYTFNWGTTVQQYGSTPTTGIVFSIPSVSGGYVLETKIPWSTIGVTPSAGKLIGFDININDNDGANGDHTRQSTTSWYSTSNQNFNNAGLFGTVSLTSCTSSGTAWSTVGNPGTNPANNFLGTTDAQNLLLKVNGGKVAQFDTHNNTSFQNSTMNNYYGTASGYSTTSTGWGSTAFGNLTVAIGGQSTATGNITTAGGFASFSTGSQTNASGNQSAAMGNLTTSGGFGSFAAGNQSTTSSDISTAIGNLVTASGYNSYATGNATTAGGQSSFTMGEGTAAPSYTEVALGSFNTTYTPLSAAAYNASDRIFSIGNGTSNVARHNALTVFKNGTVAVGTTTPPAGFLLAVNGSAVFQRIQIQAVVGGPDYVFDSTYHLISISDLSNYISIHKHLPDVPSAADMEKHGLDLSDNQSLLLRKIEELTLYTIAQDTKMKTQEQQLKDMQQEIDQLKQLISQKIAQ